MEMKMEAAAQTRHTALPLRDHTILGVCEAIGEDFGFNPTWIRVPLAATVLVSLPYAIAGYLVLGVIVLASRLMFPQPKAQAAASASAEPQQPQSAPLEPEERLPIAA